MPGFKYFFREFLLLLAIIFPITLLYMLLVK